MRNNGKMPLIGPLLICSITMFECVHVDSENSLNGCWEENGGKTYSDNGKVLIDWPALETVGIVTPFAKI